MEVSEKDLEFCTYCPKLCRHTCPVSNSLGKETLIPQAKMELYNMLRRNAVSWELDYILPLYGCTGCGLCKIYCEHNIDVAETLQMGRYTAERRRLVHPKLTRLHEQFRKRNQTLISKMHKEFSAYLFAEEAQVGFFPGCDTIDSSIHDIRDALTIFDSLDMNFVRLTDSPYVCAGYPLWAGGNIDAARFVAEEMTRTLRRFNTVVVGCAACTWLLRVKLPAEGFHHNTEILHLSEYLYLHADRLSVKRTKPAAFYHDPCYLGRYLKVFEPPRRLISRCVDSLKEFFYHMEEGECCGGGGLVPHTFPEASITQARKRLSEALHFETPLVVTSCPTCKRTFQKADMPVQVMDLVNLIAWAIRDPHRKALQSEGRSAEGSDE